MFMFLHCSAKVQPILVQLGFHSPLLPPRPPALPPNHTGGGATTHVGCATRTRDYRY